MDKLTRNAICGTVRGAEDVSGAWEYSGRRGQTEIILKRGHNLTITYRMAASQPA